MSDRKQTRLLVTDSGLGGLSVCAGMAARLADDVRYDRVHLIYFNAWPEQYKGYNHYPDPTDRPKVFHNALDAMARFNPDHIFIACNTLSVIYPFTRFAKQTQIPVTGIVDYGVEMIFNALTRDPDASAVIFATPATIQEESHKKALIHKGIDPDRIITQGCLNLAGKIERSPFSDEVGDLIDDNAAQAAGKLGESRGAQSSGTVYAGLCCTHFGYRKKSFEQDLARHTGRQVQVLNPNEAMTDGACQGIIPGGTPQISIDIVSRVTWEPSRIEAYDRLLSPVSESVVTALKNYRLDSNLFSIDID